MKYRTLAAYILFGYLGLTYIAYLMANNQGKVTEHSKLISAPPFTYLHLAFLVMIVGFAIWPDKEKSN
jgi:hypothetical protein